jgi:two-component system, sensor histidine kinase and response regulator
MKLVLNKKLFETGETEIEGIKILLVEDNYGDVVLVNELLIMAGIQFKLLQANSLKDAQKLITENKFDIILLDLGLPDSLGLETLKRIHDTGVKCPIVVMTSLDDEKISIEAIREGAQDYIVKNKLSPDMILRSINYSIERKKIEHLKKRHTLQFSILSSASDSISRCENISSVYKTTCRNIEFLLPEVIAIAVEITNGKTIKASFIDFLDPWYEKIVELTGIDLKDPVFHVNEEERELMELFKDGMLHEILGGVYGLFNRVASPEVCLKMEETLGIYNIYAIGFKKGDILYGGCIILSPMSIPDDDIHIIEAIGSQASTSIHKMSIENELRASEKRYIALSRELEIKVKARTKDLETANLQLNRELVERNLAQKELKKSEHLLRDLISTKDKFFNIVAHDLKNPFTSLLGSSELLFQNIDQMDKQEIKKLSIILNDSAKSGYAILQNLLDWSRSQAGLIKFTIEKINLKTLINENIANLDLFTSNKDITMISELNKDLFIRTDKNMVNTVLRNLLSNAVKFTRRSGKVSVSVKKLAGELIIIVSDNGVGITQENIPKLFRIDTKHSLPGTENEQGTGLGLKLSKEFSDKLNGRIWVESEVNKGSKFMFSIPYK